MRVSRASAYQYNTVVFLHVVSVFAFLLAHGVSVSVAFALKRKPDSQKIRALLDLSAASYPMMLSTLLLSIVFGIIAGFQGRWWMFGWIWVSILLLIVIIVWMTILGSNIFGEARQAAGLEYRRQGRPFPAEPPKSNEEIHAVLKKINPILLTAVSSSLPG